MNMITTPANVAGSRPCGCGGSKTGGGCSCGCGTATCTTDTLVRPRFFAGQLLTEDDLQSLEDYVAAKSRLHNSRLFGAGVVCGLEVLCHPCGGGKVTVQPGYALDCCGNDIVLQCATELDINAMIRDLRRDQLGGYDCGDPCSGASGGKPAGNALATSTSTAGAPPPAASVAREYCLYVDYCEQATDPISPYATDEPCSPQSCEPSRIREGLRFKLRCPTHRASPNDFLAAVERCLRDAVGIEKISVDTLQLLNPAVVARQFLDQKKTFEDLRSELLDVIDRSPHPVSCKLRDEVLALKAPADATPAPKPAGESLGVNPDADKTSSASTTDISALERSAGDSTAATQLAGIFVKIYKECICMAINPPCAQCDDTDVLLACLTVKDCDVVDICNLARDLVLSPAALSYWLSWDRLQAQLEAFCCPDLPCTPHQPSETVTLQRPPFNLERLGAPPAAGQPPPAAGQPPPASGQPPPAAGQPPPASEQPPPAAGQPPPAAGQPPPAAGQPPPAAGQPPPAAGQQPPAAEPAPGTLLGLPSSVAQPAQVIGHLFGILGTLTPQASKAQAFNNIARVLQTMGSSPPAPDLTSALAQANAKIDALQAKLDNAVSLLPPENTAKALQDVSEKVTALKSQVDGVASAVPTADTMHALTQASASIGTMSAQLADLKTQVETLAKRAPKKPARGGAGGANG
jgi:hypothetical protein